MKDVEKEASVLGYPNSTSTPSINNLKGVSLSAVSSGQLLAYNGSNWANKDETAIISVVLDGSGSAITTGIKADILVPYDCIITQTTLLADQDGDIAVDVWVDSYANFPPTDDDSKTTPAIPASGKKYQSGTLSIAVAANSVVRFNVDSCTTITRCLVALSIEKR